MSIGLAALARSHLTDDSPIATPEGLSKHDSAVRRAVSRKCDILPHDASHEAFERWLTATGEVIEDEEWYAELYLCTCELAGWDPILDEHDAQPEPPPPPPRSASMVIMAKPRTKLVPREAAARFGEWLQLAGHVNREITSSELDRLYDEHCTAEHIVKVQANKLRKCLRQLSFVRRERPYVKRRGKVHRASLYVIDPPEASDIPWTDLPDRKAA